MIDHAEGRGAVRDVVYVIASMHTGGTQSHILEVLRRLDRTKFRPHLFCLRDEGNLIETARGLDVPTTTFSMSGTLRNPGDLRGLLRMVTHLRRIRPAVVHGYLLRGNFFGAVAARLARVPLTVTSRRGLHRPAGAAETFAVRVSNALSAVVTGNAPQVVDFTREVEPAFSAPMEMIPSGIDIGRFDPSAVDAAARAKIRAELGVGDAPVVGTAITFRPRKGFKLLFESFSDALAQIPNAQLLIAGAAEMPADPAALAESLGITDRVHLLGRRADMPEVLSAFDLFVLPSESEGMSNAILEAMAMRLPVVATDVGGASMVIEEGKTGYLVDYPDRPAVTDRFLRVFADSVAADKMGKAAREAVVARFSTPVMVRSMEDLYERYLAAA